MTKIHVFRLVMIVQRQFKRCVSISNTTLDRSGHDSKPPSSRLGTLYSRCRQWFLTEINVLCLVLFIRHQFKCSELVHKTILSPSGLGMKTPSSRLGTLYSCYRQWFITKIYVFSLFLFVRRQFKHWGLVSNTTLGTSGHGKKPPSSRLRTLCSHYRQWFMTKIHVLWIVLFARRQFEHCVLISNTTLGPSVWSYEATIVEAEDLVRLL